MSIEPAIQLSDRDATGLRPTCLFLGSFDDRYGVLFEMLIGPVAKDCGFEAVSAETLYPEGRITDELVQRIESADLVIADIGRESLNVCYEIGVRHATGKPCLLIGDSHALPFYFRDLLVTKVKESEVDTLVSAKGQLSARILAAMKPHDRGAHPVLGAIAKPCTPLAHCDPPPTGMMYGFEHFPKRISEYLKTHAGDLSIYNMEFNTLEPTKENQSFWRLLHHRNIRSCTIAIPRNLFRRLESWLRHSEFGPQVEQMLQGVRIVPIAIPDEHRTLAFARFDPAQGGVARSWAFPKMPFYSEWQKHEGLSSEFENPGHWRYCHVIESEDFHLNEGFHSLLPDPSTSVFSVKDVRKLAVGEPEAPESIAAQHSLVGDEERRACRRVGNCIRLNITPFGELPRCNEPTKTMVNGCAAFRFGVVGGLNWTLHSLTPDSTKPILLWLPPWSHPDWQQQVKRLDAELSTAFSVVHLTFSGSPRHSTFSAALCDIRQAVREIRRGIDGLAGDRERIALVGVGVNAYLTVEAAAQMVKSDFNALLGVCMLAPAIDLFEAVDRFHNHRTAFFTRKVYMAMPKYRLGLPGMSAGLTYLGQPMTVDHLLDLRARGSKRCGRAYFRKNIEEVCDQGKPVFIGSSPLSELASHKAIGAIVKELGVNRVEHLELPWYVEIKPGGGRLRCDMSLEPGGGLAKALRFLKEQAGGTNSSTIQSKP